MIVRTTTQAWLTILAASCLLGAMASNAQARGTFNAPAGQAPATAPGGADGLAGPRNVEDAVRSGQALGVPRYDGPVRQRYDGARPGHGR